MKKSINYPLSIFLLLVGILAMVACKNKKDEDPNPAIKCETSVTELTEATTILSESKWEWVESRSEGRGGTVITTPESEGKTKSLVFSLGANVEELQNGQAMGIWTYRISVASQAQAAFSFVWLDQNGNIDRNYVADICPEVLKITDISSSLLTTTTYKRKQ